MRPLPTSATEMTVDGIVSRRRTPGNPTGVQVGRPMFSLIDDHEGADLVCICAEPDKRLKGVNYIADAQEMRYTKGRAPQIWGDLAWDPTIRF